jgi:predicted cobalt transporter CbtA
MAGSLVLRGMLAGILAGLLCFAFLKTFGEPPVDRAITFETQIDEAKEHAEAQSAAAKGMSMPADESQTEVVSRKVQAGIGLFTGVTVYSASFGGLFAVVFAFVYGRWDRVGSRNLAALLALAAFIAINVVPALKYPANPPSVGQPDTIGLRTALYFAMMAISMAAMIGAAIIRTRLVREHGLWNASLIAAAGYLIVIVAAAALLPSINEVPEAFPAVVLWQFRIASIGAQLIMWGTIGLVFGALTERAERRSDSLVARAG